MPTFDELLAQIIDLIRRDGRVTYRALKRRFDLDEEYLADLTAEIIEAKRLAVDEDGKVLVWVGEHPVVTSQSSVLRGSPETECASSYDTREVKS